ncbi:MAG: hypothetical protein ABI700_00955 [Chloroflexota bacterium]
MATHDLINMISLALNKRQAERNHTVMTRCQQHAEGRLMQNWAQTYINGSAHPDYERISRAETEIHTYVGSYEARQRLKTQKLSTFLHVNKDVDWSNYDTWYAENMHPDDFNWDAYFKQQDEADARADAEHAEYVAQLATLLNTHLRASIVEEYGEPDRYDSPSLCTCGAASEGNGECPRCQHDAYSVALRTYSVRPDQLPFKKWENLTDADRSHWLAVYNRANTDPTWIPF